MFLPPGRFVLVAAGRLGALAGWHAYSRLYRAPGLVEIVGPEGQTTESGKLPHRPSNLDFSEPLTEKH